MNKIKTAEEFLKDNFESDAINPQLLIEFAKLHLEAQQKAILENGKVELSENWIRKEETIYPGSLIIPITIKINKESILQSYSESNII